ncbi:TonB-dependent receptor domain-containing protein, partial [Xanthovirga aplysinae]|uniref:TonB-dependent receptor domain-containing protein n=1 Tax=Xanthovirga aplysinae TaxID=2529853 RepID=UPI0012BC264F
MGRVYVALIFSLIIFQFGKAFSQQKNNGAGNESGKSNKAVGVLSGKVLDDQTNEEVEFATISLYNTAELDRLVTGGISGEGGYFEILDIPAGNYIVKASFIGYKELVYPEEVQFNNSNTEINLGTIHLLSETQELEEVAVVADKEMMVNSIDKKSFNVEQDATSQGGDASDVLSKLPSVDVDVDGNISLRGSEGVTILIDGKLSAMSGQDASSVLDQIPSSSIESVEVITNPSAKYSAEGTAGIINIILKKGEKKGTSGSASISAGTGDKYNTALSLNHSVGKFNFFGNYTYRNDKLQDASTLYKENYNSDYTSFLNQTSEGFNQKVVNNLNLGMDFNLDDFNTIGLSGSFNSNSRYKEETFHSLTTFSDDSPTIEDSRFTTSDVNRQNVETTLDYQRKFLDPNKKLDASFSYSNAQNDNNSFFGATNNSVLNSNSHLWQGQIDFTQTFSNQLKLETGWSSRLFQSNDDFQSFIRENEQSEFLPDQSSFFNFNYQEDVHALYGLLSGQLENEINYQVGVRAEQTFTTSSLSNFPEDFQNNYFSLYPSLHLSKGFGEKGSLGYSSELQLSYSRRLNRPKSRWLNPFVDLSNPQNIKFGNPYLTPEYIDSYELSYLRSWSSTTFLGSLYLKHSKDPIARVFYNDPSLNIVQSTWENLASSNTIGGELNLNSQLTDWWNINANFNYFYFDMDGSNIEGEDFSNSGFGWTSKLMSSLDLWKGGSMQISARYTSARNVAGGKMQGFLFSDVAFKQKVLNNQGTISLRVNDPFNLFRFQIETADNTFYQELLRDRESQIVYLGFSFNIGNLKFPSKNKSKKGSNKD